MKELFAAATNGYSLDDYDLEMLLFYINIGEEKDILFLIEQMSDTYPDAELAEVGFVVVWDAVVTARKQNK